MRHSALASTRWLLGALVIVSAWHSPAQLHAQAAPAVNEPAEVLVILASETDGKIDAALDGIKALKQPPFNVYKSMKVLTQSTVEMKAQTPSTVDLPNGRRLQLEFLERMPDGRTKVQVSINRPNQKDYLPLLQVVASAGEPFFVAGQKFQGGTLVIGVRVGKKH